MSGSPTFRTPWKVAEKQDTPILTGLRTLVADQEWEVEVIPLVVGQRSVKEKEWLETLSIGKPLRKASPYLRIPLHPLSLHAVSPSITLFIYARRCLCLYRILNPKRIYSETLNPKRIYSRNPKP